MAKIDISWSQCNKVADDDLIKAVEKLLGVKFSSDYVEYAKQYHGGIPNKTDFDYFDPAKNATSVSGQRQLLYLDINKPGNIIRNYQTLADEYFPKGIIPFGSTGGGYTICFDYRENASSPSGVLWKHERKI